jgi:putative lipoic acid-binding regulatory protein
VTCVYKTGSSKDFNKHLLTGKHKILTNPNSEILEIPQKNYKCNCGKEYKHSSSLCAHRKKCSIHKEPIVDPSANEIKLLTNLVIELVKSNNDLQKQVVDVCQKIQPNNTNSHNTNTHSNNKTFNLQLFLNEECKDAMNMSEFINSIVVKLSDLDNIGKLGYVEGMSDMIIKQLKDTDVNKRPVHCSDAKRETLYVKEENKWEKDTEQMARAVRGVDKKNYTLLANWKDMNPNCTSKQSDNYVKVVGEIMDGDEENVNKVIKNVAKQLVIDK